jgi:hypothetical protein
MAWYSRRVSRTSIVVLFLADGTDASAPDAGPTIDVTGSKMHDALRRGVHGLFKEYRFREVLVGFGIVEVTRRHNEFRSCHT